MSGQRQRLAGGGLVDRSRTIPFFFDGKPYAGHPGDTLASALLANGVRLMGRSFKYHRPRGLLSAGPEEPNALVELRSGARREPNTRATVIELFEGLEANSQNRWPSLGFDLMAVNQLFAPFFAAGFYYKTFMWPAAFWEKLYEPLIRRAAGLGRAPLAADPDPYEKAWAFCDVLVIGAGPAGLMAALAAARSGARVILADEDFQPGGRVLAERQGLDGLAGSDWAARCLAELGAHPECRVMPRTTVFGVFDDGIYGALERVSDHLPVPPPHQPRQRLWRIAARRTVLATGSLERPILFGDNDTPGVMLAGAVRSYLNRFAVAAGQRAVVFTDNDDGWRTAADLRAAGVEVAALVDPRDGSRTAALAAAQPGLRVLRGTVDRACGFQRVSSVDVTVEGRRTRIGCDLLAVSGGWTPTLHLASHHGHRPRWDEARALFLPDRLPPGMQVAGAANGDFTLQEALASGQRAGIEAAQELGFTATAAALPTVEAAESAAREVLWQSPTARGKCFVDFQNDVTREDVALAAQEGYQSVELLKRYTTLGMATDQGKTSSVAAIALLAQATGRPIAGTGTTTFRPPYTPVALGALTGPYRGLHFRPTRRTAAHAWWARRGASFIETGPWLRAQYFLEPGEADDWFAPTVREVRAVRERVGICDVSTLGKIDLQGPDAARFLDRLYANTLSTLAVGRARYGVMLREDGFVMDDGTVARLGDERYLITTTTANAVSVYQHMHFCHQVLWPDLDVQFVSVTEQWAQFSVAGPHSRTLLQRIADPGQDISDAAFPYLAAGEFRVLGGVRGRLFRISFSGERAYEIAVPASHAEALLDALFAKGEDLGLAPYGLEALSVLRIEKGHPAGAELSGQTTAADLGLAKLVSVKKDFIGAVMARRPALLDPTRPRLVGLTPIHPEDRLHGGAQFVPIGVTASAEHNEGYMTSVAYSPVLGHWIGLGLLTRGHERLGERIRACDPLRGREVIVEVCSPHFLDPQGDRLRG
jgi:sarcosine oxidase subunit alpha